MIHVMMPSNGVAFIADEEDYELANAYTWRLSPEKKHGKRYACRSRPGMGYMPFHREVMGAKPGQLVDHVNGDTLDNRRCNLRIASYRQNSQNVRSSQNQKKGLFKGVFRNRSPVRPYKAQIRVPTGDGSTSRALFLGTFSDAKEAARAYDNAARRYFGEFAACNFDSESSK